MENGALRCLAAGQPAVLDNAEVPMILAVLASVRAAQKHLSSSMAEIYVSEKRQGLHLACFRYIDVESKRNSPARRPKMRVKCGSQARLSIPIILGLRGKQR
jgi:hypothetical protein